MEEIHIEQTSKSPVLIFKDGYIRMSGRSIPQNARQMYQACFDWMDNYVKSPVPETKVDLFFEYIDTSSIRCIFEIFSKLCSVPNAENLITINWYYEADDDDAHDLGAYIQTYLKVTFNIIPVLENQEIF